MKQKKHKKRRLEKVTDWSRYEQEKKSILVYSPASYDGEIKRIVRRLGV